MILPVTYFSDDENYSITIEEDGPPTAMPYGRIQPSGGVVVYSECCADRMSREVAETVYHALGKYLGKE